MNGKLNLRIAGKQVKCMKVRLCVMCIKPATISNYRSKRIIISKLKQLLNYC